jgi:hypothetical protein
VVATVIIGEELSDDPAENARKIIQLSKDNGVCIKNVVYSTVVGTVIEGVSNDLTVDRLFETMDPIFKTYRELVLMALEEAKVKPKSKSDEN